MKRLLLSIVIFAARLFYREKRLGGDVPSTGPLLLVSNHPNGLVDPVFLQASTQRDVRLLAKAPLFDMPVIGPLVRRFGALPVYRTQDGADTSLNERTFEAVWEALAQGDAIALFPEGRSHSEPGLQRLKTGAARMALGAEQRSGYRLGVRIVPVGLVYANKGTFRSQVACWVGEPLDVGELAELHRTDERAAVAELNARIAAALARVTVDLDRWEDLPLLRLAERIWQPARGPRRVERMAGLAEALRVLRRERAAEVQALEARVVDFGDRLERLGLEVDDLRIDYTPALVLRFVARNVVAVLLGLPLAALGLLVWCPPFWLVRAAVKWRSPTPDVAATEKLLAALAVYPLWLAVLLFAAGALFGWLGAVAVSLAAPGLGLFGLRFYERREAALEDAAVFVRMGRAGGAKQRLRRRREALAAEIEELSRSYFGEAG